MHLGRVAVPEGSLWSYLARLKLTTMQTLLLRSAQKSGRYVTEIFVGLIAFMRLIEG